ncbi:MAG TPA: sensor histidine kinase [Ktedonobacteraceae bacterium]|nr:sensor histidine kinase [Ktedonobacteraceae bacterium]
MSLSIHQPAGSRERRRLSLFEKVILVNALMLIGEALAGLWVTSHSLESHHYLIDTSFIVIATLCSLFINVLLLRASFRPLFSLLRTIRAVGAGDTALRAVDIAADSEIGELALAFNRMLDQLEASRRQQAMLILQAQEEERRRLARELHDESSQNLTALLVHTEILNQTLVNMPGGAAIQEVRAQLQPGLHQLTQLTQKTLENIRTLALQLRPGILDDLGLDAAFRWLAEDCRNRLHLAVELRVDGLEETLRTRGQLALYAATLFRIAQECLTNAARHARAKRVVISFTSDQDFLHLKVCDDGDGFDVSQSPTGLGIRGMRERTALLGGELVIVSQPGKGTTIEARLPLTLTPVEESPGVQF